MKHTPGPWEATPGEIIGKRVANGSMDLICDLRGSPFVDDIPYNSLLIAASPELLEALEELINATYYVLKNGGDILTSSSWHKAENAIAKAEGRQP